MYEVVGCRECGELWIREGNAETASCPRCGRRFQVGRLRTLGSAESAEIARDIRSDLLADRSEFGDIVAGYRDIDGDERAIDDEPYLTALGVDTDEITAAGEDVGEQRPSRTEREIVLDAIDEAERPSIDRIVTAAAEYGLSKDGVEDLLDRLHAAGDVTFDGEEYRRI